MLSWSLTLLLRWSIALNQHDSTTVAVEVVNLSPDSVISIWTLHTAITSEEIAVGLLACNVPRLLNYLLDTFFTLLKLIPIMLLELIPIMFYYGSQNGFWALFFLCPYNVCPKWLHSHLLKYGKTQRFSFLSFHSLQNAHKTLFLNKHKYLYLLSY